MESPWNAKRIARERLKKIRSGISKMRRIAAVRDLLADLRIRSISDRWILSFMSFGDEIDTELLNFGIANQGSLLLPRIEGKDLVAYHVTDLKEQMVCNSFGVLEPNPDVCKKISPDQIGIIFVPALGFDRNHQRIGYGMGFYDRFLPTAQKSLKIGIGFQEQLVFSLPIEKTDVPLNEVFLY